MNKIVTELPIGTFTVDISHRLVVHILKKYDSINRLHCNKIVFRAMVEKDDFIKVGWTMTTILSKVFIENIAKVDNVLLLKPEFIIFDLEGNELS